MFCKRCGQRLPDDSEFCFSCGTPIVNPASFNALPEDETRINNPDSSRQSEFGKVEKNFAPSESIIERSRDFYSSNSFRNRLKNIINIVKEKPRLYAIVAGVVLVVGLLGIVMAFNNSGKGSTDKQPEEDLILSESTTFAGENEPIPGDRTEYVYNSEGRLEYKYQEMLSSLPKTPSIFTLYYYVYNDDGQR